MKYLKKFEGIFRYRKGNIDIGNKFHEGKLGVLVDISEFDKVSFMLKDLSEMDIDIMVFFGDKILLILLKEYGDFRELTKLQFDDGDVDDDEPYGRYIQYDSNGGGIRLQRYYQDIIDENITDQFIIENDGDIDKLIDDLRLRYEANKFNL